VPSRSLDPSTQDTAWPYALGSGRPEQNESRDDDFLGQNVGIGKVVRIFEAFVAEPEDVKTGFGVVRSLIHLFKPNPNAVPKTSKLTATHTLN
jgi:hypothetical protein